MRRLGPTRRGFTCAELVIVTVLGGFAAGLLLPTISTEQSQATQVRCASNLKQIGIATLNYTMDYREYLPPLPEAGHSPLRGGLQAFSRGNFWDEKSFANYEPRVDPNSTETATDPGAGIFRLMLTGYLGKWAYKPAGGLASNTPRNVVAAAADPNYFPVRFCPGQQPILADVAKDWGGSYFYNPHWIDVDPGYWQAVVGNNPAVKNLAVGDEPVTAWYTRISNYPRDCALCCDMITSSRFVAHPSGRGGAAVWNLLFADGHVASISDKFVTASLAGAGDATVGGNQGPADNTVAGLKIFDDYLDILEAEASGKNPLIQNLYPAPANNRQTRLKDREVGAKKDVVAKQF
jgi:hypothetical protein